MGDGAGVEDKEDEGEEGGNGEDGGKGEVAYGDKVCDVASRS
jgi:hypothetical protein